jgi:ABC-2 type transport system permease protein
MAALQLALACMTGGLVRSFLAAAAIAAGAIPFVREGHRPILGIVALGLTGLAFSALGVITGIWATSFDQHSFVASIVITPLALLGGVFYSARTLDAPRRP